MITLLRTLLSVRHLQTLLVIAILSALALPVNLLARNAPPITPERIVYVTSDSLRLVGYVALPTVTTEGKPPLIVLLHSETGTIDDWQDFAQLLCESGFAVMAMDVRGCGEPIFDYRIHQDRPPGTTREGDNDHYQSDVTMMVEKVIKNYEKSVDTTRLAIIGSSLGANIGMMYAATDPRVKFTVLISPGLEIRKQRIAPVIKEFGDRPLMLATADKDVYSFESCTMLSDVTPRPLDIHVYESYFGGNKLLSSQQQLVKDIIENLKKYLQQPW